MRKVPSVSGFASLIVIVLFVTGCIRGQAEVSNSESEEQKSNNSNIAPVTGSMTCSGESDQEYGRGTGATKMVYDVRIPKDVDQPGKGLPEQYATVTAWRKENNRGEKWGPFKLDYAQGNSGYWKYAKAYKFSLKRDNGGRYKLTHKVEDVKDRIGSLVTLTATITCN